MRSLPLLWPLIITMVFCQYVAGEEIREDSGSLTSKAEFSGILVVLKLEDGTLNNVPIAQLGKEDQLFILGKLNDEITNGSDEQAVNKNCTFREIGRQPRWCAHRIRSRFLRKCS